MRQPMSKQERKAHILDTAKRLFEEKGYDHVTITDVIAASNVARGTFYLYFDSLETLLATLFDEVVDEAWRRISPLLEDLSIPFETCTTLVIRSVYQMFQDNPELGSVFYAGGGQAFVERKQTAMFDKLGGLLVKALERRHNTQIPHLEWTAAMLIALVGDMSYFALLNAKSTADERAAFETKLEQFVLGGLAAHLSPLLNEARPSSGIAISDDSV